LGSELQLFRINDFVKFDWDLSSVDPIRKCFMRSCKVLTL
jgi:hypothetical protein